MKKITENNLYTRLTNNLPMKLLSVVLAFFVWLLVTNINDPETTRRFYDIPVHIVNEDALTDRNYGYEILEGKTVDITVTGKKVCYAEGFCRQLYSHSRLIKTI